MPSNSPTPPYEAPQVEEIEANGPVSTSAGVASNV
jgi:hypothetical protein